MLTPESFNQFADEMEEIISSVDPDNANDLRRTLIQQMAWVSGWISSLRDFDAVPGTARMELENALQAVERAARAVDREITDGLHLLD